MRHRALPLAASIVFLCCCVASAGFLAAADKDAAAGNVTGKFVFDGDLPKVKMRARGKDTEVCGKVGPEEGLAVDKDGGIADVVVMLAPVKPGEKRPQPNAKFVAGAGKEVIIDNKACRFEPRICVLQTNQKLVVTNTDKVGHNVKVDCLANTAFNDLVAAGGRIVKAGLTKEERVPITVSCNIHEWMTARVIIRDDSYVAVSKPDGTFTLAGLPEGKWKLRAWHEAPGNVVEVKLDGKTKLWPKGEFEVTIDADKNVDLGEIRLPAKLFSKK